MRKGQVGQLRLGLAANEILDYQYLRALTYAAYGGSSIGEVLKAANEIRRLGTTRQAWIDVWTKLGRQLAAYAAEAEQAGRKTTASESYLRAYNYLRAAEFYFYRDRSDEHLRLYRESVACFDSAMELLPYRTEKIAIPYEAGTTLPGYFFQPSSEAALRPTIVICGGGDSYGEESYFTAGIPAALARGFNVVAFHGPGQRGVLLEHPELVFRPDAEVPVGAVIDYTISRTEVDPDRLALYGYSFGGYLAPRACASDHRMKALVANAPLEGPREAVVGGLIAQLPAPLQSAAGLYIDRAGTRSFDLLAQVAQRQWPVGATIELYMLWVTGLQSLGQWMERIKDFALTPEIIKQITCPTLCLSAEGEGAEPTRQARSFFDTLECPKEFITLSADYGADNHVGLDNIGYTSALAYDWLQTTLGAHPARERVSTGSQSRRLARELPS